MAKKQKTKPMRKPRQKPAYLPGLEPVSIPALDEAADGAYDATQDRLAAAEVERTARATLLELMHEHDQKTYETPAGLVVKIEADEKVSCKKKKEKTVNLNGSE